jgi:hypothetical protein
LQQGDEERHGAFELVTQLQVHSLAKLLKEMGTSEENGSGNACLTK